MEIQASVFKFYRIKGKFSASHHMIVIQNQNDDRRPVKMRTMK